MFIASAPDIDFFNNLKAKSMIHTILENPIFQPYGNKQSRSIENSLGQNVSQLKAFFPLMLSL